MGWDPWRFTLAAAQTALAITIGVALLHAFYRAVEFRWPASYMGAGDTGLYAILSTPGRYIAFRVVPVYIACVLVATSSARAGLDPLIASLGVAALHGVVTNGRVALQEVRTQAVVLRHRFPFVILRLFALLLILVVGVVGAYSHEAAAPLVPTLEQVGATLWTALLAGILAAYVMKTTARGGGGVDELIVRSYASLDEGLWEMAQVRALEHGADPRLLRAVMLIENIQRPAWLRSLEYAKARIVPAGTYGVMQVASSTPISDAESIEKAAIRLSGVSVWDDEIGVPDFDAVESAARSYNPDPAYPELLVAALNFVGRRN